MLTARVWELGEGMSAEQDVMSCDDENGEHEARMTARTAVRVRWTTIEVAF